MQWGICAHYGVYAPEPGQGVGGLDIFCYLKKKKREREEEEEGCFVTFVYIVVRAQPK